MKNSSSDTTVNPSPSSTNTIDISAILRALLSKQNHHIPTIETNVTNNTENATCSPTSPSSLPPVNTSQIQSDSSTTAAS